MFKAHNKHIACTSHYLRYMSILIGRFKEFTHFTHFIQYNPLILLFCFSEGEMNEEGFKLLDLVTIASLIPRIGTRLTEV